MQEKWIFVGRTIHIISGFIALLCGLILVFSKKGTTIHKQLGRVFVLTLLLTCLFSLLLQIGRYFDPILSYQAVLGIYLGISGFLDFNNFYKTQIKDILQFILPFLIFVFCIALSVMSLQGTINKNPSLILATISGGFIFSTVDITLQIIRHRSSKERRHIRLSHGIKLVTALIIMLSAFSSTTFKFLPTPYKEIWPTVIGLPILYFWAIRELFKTRKLPPT